MRLFRPLEFLSLFAVGACSPQPSYLIEAEVPDCSDCKAILWHDLGDHTVPVDSGIVRGGQLRLQGHVTETGVYKLTYLGAHAVHTIRLYFPADSVRIAIYPQLSTRRDLAVLYQQKELGSHLREYRVQSTTGVQRDLEAYLLANDSLWNKYFVDKNLVNAKLEQTFSTRDSTLIAQWADSSNHFRDRFSAYLRTSVVVFSRQYPRSLIVPFAWLDGTNTPTDLLQLRAIFQSLTPAQQNSSYGKLMARRAQL